MFTAGMKSATELLFPGDGELATLMRKADWAMTPLGAIETWPNGLRAAVRIVLTSRFSMWMAWGSSAASIASLATYRSR